MGPNPAATGAPPARRQPDSGLAGLVRSIRGAERAWLPSVPAGAAPAVTQHGPTQLPASPREEGTRGWAEGKKDREQKGE